MHKITQFIVLHLEFRCDLQILITVKNDWKFPLLISVINIYKFPYSSIFNILFFTHITLGP